MTKRTKKILITVAAVVVVGIVAVICLFKSMQDKVDKQVNEEIHMEQVADGIYKGSSDIGLVKVEVEVEVKDHKIVNINLLKHQCGTGKPAESMIDEMVKENTDDVDCVSGATFSSKTIRNAVNKALQQGLNKQ